VASICIIEETITEIVVVEEVCDIVVEEDTVQLTLLDAAIPVSLEDEGTLTITEEPTNPIIAECKVGPPGQNGLDGFGILQIDSGPVANGATVNADAVAIATFRSAKWLVTIKDETAGTYRFYEVIAVHNGTIALYSVYGKVGAIISVFTDVTIVAGFMRLEITNNSTNSIDISVMRIVTTV